MYWTILGQADSKEPSRNKSEKFLGSEHGLDPHMQMGTHWLQEHKQELKPCFISFQKGRFDIGLDMHELPCV